MGDILHIFSCVSCEVNAAGCSLHLKLKQLYSSGAVKMSVLENGNGLLAHTCSSVKKMFTEKCLFSSFISFLFICLERYL